MAIDFEEKRRRAAAQDAKTYAAMAADTQKLAAAQQSTPAKAPTPLFPPSTMPTSPQPFGREMPDILTPTNRNSILNLSKKPEPKLGTPLFSALSSGSALSKNATDITPPKLPERTSKLITGAAKSSGGGALNALSVASRAIESNVNQEPLIPFYKSEIERLEKKLQGKLMPLKRKTIEDDILMYKQLLEGKNPSHEKALGIIESGASDIERAKEGTGFWGGLGVDVGTGITQLGIDYAVGKALGTGVDLPIAVRSFGSGAHKAEQEGASLGQQAGYGALSATAAVLTNKIFNVGKVMKGVFGKGLADDALEKGVTAGVGKLIKNPQVASYIGTIIASAGGEGFEEFLESMLDPLWERMTYNPDAKVTAETVSESVYEGAVGAIIGALGAAAGGPSTQLSDTAKANADITTSIAQNTSPDLTQARTSAQDSLGGKLPTEAQSAPQGIVEPAMVIEPMAKPREQTGPHIDERGYSDVSSRKVKAFQFDNPELHEHYVVVARDLQNDLRMATKGERFGVKDSDGYYVDSIGIKRSVSPEIETLLDNAKLSYAQIEKGLADLIADHGQENYAAAKKIELVLDDMLTNGYEVEGYQMEPDYEYIRKKEAIKSGEQANDYSMTEDEWNALLNSEPSPSASSIFPENSLGAKITQQLPQGAGAASPEFAYQERINQQHSTDTAFTETERQIPGLRHEDSTHQVITDKNAMAQAEQRLAFDFDGEKADLATKQDWDKADTTTAHLILRKLTADARESGDYSEVIKWNETLENRKSAQGQALQANSQFANTPEAIIAESAETLFSDKTKNISEAKKAALMEKISKSAETLDNIQFGDSASVIELIKDLSAQRKTDGVWNKQMSNTMQSALDYFAGQPDGFDFLKDIAAGQVRSIASDYNKVGFWSGVKSVRFSNMLSSIATVMRNLGGNQMLDIGDSVSNNVAIPFDMMLSKLSGNRSVAFDASWFSEAKRNGSIDGFLKSFVQVALDVDIDNVRSKYETTPGRTFKMTGNPVERFLSTVQKWQGYALQSTDEFAKGGTKAEAQRGIDKLKQRGKTSADALSDRAQEIALQRTFQNDGKTAKMVLGLRKSMNAYSLTDSQGGSFGVGDLLVPFAQVPSNLAGQAASRTPAGLAKSVVQFANAIGKAKQGKLSPDQQASIATNLGRGLTGTAGFAFFTGLAIKGILKSVGSDDKDKDALERSEGQSGTQLNLDALVRWAKGGSAEWQSGDNLVNIGFLEHLNVQLAGGVLIAEAYKDDGKISAAEIAKASVQSVFQTVLELPAISQLSDVLDSYRYSKAEDVSGKLADAAGTTLGGQASSFLVPNLVAGIARGLDDKVRDVHTSDNVFKQTKDDIYSKIPGLRKSLPAKLDPWGDERTTGHSNLLNFFNATVLPGKISQYQTSDINKEIFRLDAADTNIKFPTRKMTKKLSYDNEDYDLDQKEQEDFHSKSHQLAKEYMGEAIGDKKYKSMSDGEKAKLLNDMYGFAIDTAKREYFANLGIEYSSDYDKTLKVQQSGMEPTTHYHYKSAIKKERPEGGTPSQLQLSKAIDSLDLTIKQKGTLWDIQNGQQSDKNPFTGKLATEYGVSAKETIRMMENFNRIRDSVESYEKAEGGPGKSQVQAAYFMQWLRDAGYNPAEVDAISNVFRVWQMIPIEKPSKKAAAYAINNPLE